jgi:hypothetical protein
LEVKMSKGIWRLVVVVIALVLCTGVMWGADRARDRKQDGSGDGPVQEQLKDGSCGSENPEPAAQAVQSRAGNGAGEAKQAQNGPAANQGDDEPDRTQKRAGEGNAQGITDRDRTQAQDGSCQD